MVVWPEEMIRREKRRLFRTGVGAVVLYFAPLVAAAALQGQPPWEIPRFHPAIPLVLIGLLPVAYFVMPMFDGVLVFGSVRPTTPRAALFVRCVIADGIAVLSMYLFVHSGELMWPAIYWVLGLPAALGIPRRIGAYQAAMERIASGQTADR